jgi:hypothetical protein
MVPGGSGRRDCDRRMHHQDHGTKAPIRRAPSIVRPVNLADHSTVHDRAADHHDAATVGD